MLPSLLLAFPLSPASSLLQPQSKNAIRRRTALFDAVNSEHEAHLQGISVGIDLGTTNSAVAMMIPCENKSG